MRPQNASASLERVIIVENCPCDCPRLNSKDELDILIWYWRVKRRGSGIRIIKSERVCFLVSPFLITKIFTVHSELRQYCSELIDGQLEEEKVQIYIRLGISLLYKGTTGRMEGGRGLLFSLVSYHSPLITLALIAQRLLKSLLTSQIVAHWTRNKYDAPELAHDLIRNFNEFFNR